MTTDPDTWREPDGNLDSFSDGDWLRSQAVSNFIGEDMPRAFAIADRIDSLFAEADGLRHELAAIEETATLAVCMHCRQRIPRDQDGMIREHMFTCASNPMVTELQAWRMLASFYRSTALCGEALVHSNDVYLEQMRAMAAGNPVPALGHSMGGGKGGG